MASASSGPAGHFGLTDNQKRWSVFGIALNKIFIPQIRPFVEQEINSEYNNLKTSHNIHVQSTSRRLRRWPGKKFLKYENINGNDVRHPKIAGRRYNYALFDCHVLTHVDFARLYVENHMAKFNAFDDHCDASAVLSLLIVFFTAAVQMAAANVRKARNDWAHCGFSKWDQAKFQQSFNEMEHLVKAMALPAADEGKLLGELKDWETKGIHLCMNSPVDPVLLQLVQTEVKALKDDVENMSVEVEEEKTKVCDELQNCVTALEDMKQRVETLEISQQTLQHHTKQMENRVDDIENKVVDLTESVQVSKDNMKNLQDEFEELKKTSDELLQRDKLGTQGLLVEPYLPPIDRHFTGRDREREKIITCLNSDSNRIVSVYGSPGFGKSQVVRGVGHDLKSQGKSVYYIDLSEAHSKDILISALLRYFVFLSSISFNDHCSGYLKPEDFLVHQLSKTNDRVYYILDNADPLLEPKVKDGVVNLLKEILTNCPNVTFLVASRESTEFSKLKSLGQKLVRIGSLDSLSSQNLVKKWVTEASDADCKKIAQFCGNMPFAIRLLCKFISPTELPLTQAIDNFVRSSESVLSRLDDPDEVSDSRLNCILDSSYQRLVTEKKEAIVSLSVIPRAFDVQVAAAVWGMKESDADKTLQSLHRKALIDLSSQPGAYKMHKIIRLFARQKGEQEMNELLLNSKGYFLDYYISSFIKLNDLFLSGNSTSAFIGFHENKQSIVASLIDGCAEGTTRKKSFDALIKGVLFLDAVFWGDRASFNKIYDSAIMEAKQHGNGTARDQLVLAKAFSEVTWGTDEGETMQMFCNTKEIGACFSDGEKGKLLCYLGIHELTNGKTEDGVRHLESSLTFLSDTTDPLLKILKLLSFQILSLYYKSGNNVNRADRFYKSASEVCEAVGSQSLLVIPNMPSRGLRTKEEEQERDENLPLRLELYFLMSKAVKIFSTVETMKSFENDVLRIKEKVDASLSANSEVGLFCLYRSIVGILAEMSRYEEAVKSIQAVIKIQEKALNQHTNSSDQDTEDELFGERRLQGRKEVLAKSYFYLAVLQFRTKDYEASFEAQKRALEIREELFDEPHADIADSCHELGIILRTLGHCESALHFQNRALNIRSKLSSEFPLKEADSHHEVGVTECRLGNYTSALRSHEKALDIRLKYLGNLHLDTASGHHELGITYWYMEEYERALVSHKKALSIARQVMGENHTATADSHHEIGKTHFCLQDYRAALESYLDELRSRLHMFGEQHVLTTRSRYEIGVTLFQMKEYSLALKYHMSALTSRQALYEEQRAGHRSDLEVGHTRVLKGVEPEDIADSLLQLALVYWELKDYQLSLQRHQDALNVRLKYFGKYHAKTVESYFQLGLRQSDLGLHSEALHSHQQALQIKLKSFGYCHTETANSYLEIGSIQIKSEDFDSALTSFEKALEIKTILLAKEKEEVSKLSHDQQVKRYLLQDSHASALQLYKHVSKLSEECSSSCQLAKNLLDKRLGDLKEELIKKADTCLDVEWKEEKSNLVILSEEEFLPGQNLLTFKCSPCGDLNSACQLAQQALQIRRGLFDENHLDVATCYVLIGDLQHYIGNIRGALHSHELALKIRREQLGEDHLETGWSYINLGHVQFHMKHFSAALKSQRRALQIFRERLDENNPLTAHTLYEIEITEAAAYKSALALD